MNEHESNKKGKTIIEFLNSSESAKNIIQEIDNIIAEDEFEEKDKIYKFSVENLPNEILNISLNIEDDKFPTLFLILYLFAQRIDKVKYIEPYYNAIYKSKILLLKSNTLLIDNEANTEWAFRKWINICMNYDADISVRTFFDIKEINPEEEIKGILFDKEDKLRSNFISNEKLNYILPVVADWFLKRYNIKDFKKINNECINLKEDIKFKGLKKKIPLKSLIPRLISGIIVGYIPLISATEIWVWLINMGSIKLSFLVTVSLVLCIIYLYSEINNTIRNKYECIVRTGKIYLRGVIYSVAMGTFITLYFYDEIVKSLVKQELIAVNIPICEIRFKIVFGYFALALLFGIFLQIIWEDKPITHPI